MSVRIMIGNVLDKLRELPDESVHMAVTSPPYYGLRDYGVAGQIGLEPTLDEYLAKMVEVFREVRRVLRSDGTLWLNIGDSYAAAGGAGWQGKNGQRADRRFTAQRDSVALRDIGRAPPDGLKPKDLMGVPWRLAFALQADGWWLRSEIIWHKRSTMPESVRDRPTKAHEHIFLLAKSERYFYDAEAASEPVAEDTPSRYERGRSDSHKYADGGPGDQTINRGFAHMVGIGHNERERKAVPNVKRSGNKERKPASARGVPVDTDGSTNGAVAGSIPWEGSTRNWRDVWSLGPEPFKEAHFATFPTEIPRRAIVAGCPQHGTVLDPFGGSGTTGLVADRLQRDAILIELNPEYAAMARRRISGDAPLFAEVA